MRGESLLWISDWVDLDYDVALNPKSEIRNPQSEMEVAMFFTADPKDILDGKITDVYFERALRILKARAINPVVKAEFIAKNLPEEWKWAVFTGIDESLPLLKQLGIKVRAMKEGTGLLSL